MSEAPLCKICKRPMSQVGDPSSADCGGDCQRCMAESGDTGCIVAEIIGQVERLFAGYRFRYSSEADLHQKLATVLRDAGIEFEHEKIDALGRYDFILTGGVVLEIKVAGSLAEALRQADRYCARPAVNAVLIFSTRAWAVVQRRYEMREKPVKVLRLERDAL